MSGSRRPAKPTARRRRTSGSTSRYRVTLVVLLALLGLIVVRLVWVQGIMASEYSERARKQRLQDIQITPRRGTIYDREGEPLATSIEARTIYANPRQVRDKVGTARLLAQILGGKPAEYEEILSKDTGFAYVKRKVDLETAKQVEVLKIQGIGMLEDSKRVYPAGTIAPQVLGFVGTDAIGLVGIEAQYEDVLGGKPGVLLAERDPLGHEIPGGVMKSVPPVQGKDIVLTIDKDIQIAVQRELAKAVKDYGAKRGSVVVMDPKTGEILAMATVPQFDPTKFATADPETFRNVPVCGPYEPGSTLKSFIAAEAIEVRKMSPTTKLALPATLKVRGHVIKESHPRPAVRWTLADIVTMSSNVGAAKVGISLGPRRLRAGLKRMGFGQSTGVDFPGEQIGWFPEPEDLNDLTIANISFGQGLTVTPLQLARAMAAVANGGEITTPHFLLSEPQGTTRTWPKKRVLSKRTSTLMTKMLGDVVKKGTGQKAAVSGFRVAGKTGTAEVALPNGRGYAKGVYNSSFVGFLPAEDPAVVIGVMLESPTKGYYGGSVAGPTFSTIAAYCMSHMNVSPPQQLKRSKEATSTPQKAAPAGKKAPAKPVSGTARSRPATTGNDAVTAGEPEPKTP